MVRPGYGRGAAAANALDAPSRPVAGHMKAAIRILTRLGRAVVTVAVFSITLEPASGQPPDAMKRVH